MGPGELSGKTLSCDRCSLGSNPGIGMWEGCVRLCKITGIPCDLLFPPPHKTTYFAPQIEYSAFLPVSTKLIFLACIR